MIRSFSLFRTLQWRVVGFSATPSRPLYHSDVSGKQKQFLLAFSSSSSQILNKPSSFQPRSPFFPTSTLSNFPLLSRNIGSGGRGDGDGGDWVSGNGNGKVFVSNYYQEIGKDDMENYFKKEKIAWKHGTSDSLFVLKECPDCPDHKNHLSNLWKLNFYSSGRYFCHRCRAKGSWFDFKKKRKGLWQEISSSPLSQGYPRPYQQGRRWGNVVGQKKQEEEEIQSQPKEDLNIKSKLETAASYSSNLQNKKYSRVLDYLRHVRGLTLETLEKYQVFFLFFFFLFLFFSFLSCLE